MVVGALLIQQSLNSTLGVRLTLSTGDFWGVGRYRESALVGCTNVVLVG